MGTSASFETHAVRGRFNAGFFAALDGYINWLTRDKKREVFSGLPRQVVEIGPGTGANFRYMPPGPARLGETSARRYADRCAGGVRGL